MRRWVMWLATKASRETTSGQFIPVIDGLRFIAIFSVILFHIYTFVSRKSGQDTPTDALAILFSHGYIGVHLFFIISGFVIALPFAKRYFLNENLPQLRQYYFRRLTRLEPPYFLNLLIYCPFVLVVNHATVGDLVPRLLASMGYLHNIIYGEMSFINFVAWSLEIELQFYILAPIISSIFMVQSKYVRRGLLVLIIIFFSVMSYVTTDAPRYSLSILAVAQFFLAGFLLVDIYLCEWKQSPVKSYSWDIVSVLAWLMICSLLYKGKAGELFIVAPMFIAYYAAFKGILSNQFFSKPLIYIIGGMCYTIYLYHYIVIFTFGRLIERTGILDPAPPWLRIITIGLAVIPLILVCCTFMFILIEKPCMKKNWHLRLLERFKSGNKRLEGMLR